MSSSSSLPETPQQNSPHASLISITDSIPTSDSQDSLSNILFLMDDQSASMNNPRETVRGGPTSGNGGIQTRHPRTSTSSLAKKANAGAGRDRHVTFSPETHEELGSTGSLSSGAAGSQGAAQSPQWSGHAGSEEDGSAHSPKSRLSRFFEHLAGDKGSLSKKTYPGRSLNSRLLKELIKGQKELVQTQKRTNELLVEIRANQRNILSAQHAARGRGYDRPDSPDPRLSNTWRRDALHNSRDRVAPNSPDRRLSPSAFPVPPSQPIYRGRPTDARRHMLPQL